jgi:multiple sugar transport system permease protein
MKRKTAEQPRRSRLRFGSAPKGRGSLYRYAAPRRGRDQPRPTGGPSTAHRGTSGGALRWKTAVGLALTAVMLFPVYWMVNVSLTRPEDMRRESPSLLPLDPTFEGYDAVLRDQLPYLRTSLLIGLGTVAVTLAIAAPAAYALARLRPRGGGLLSFVLLVAQMIPGIIMAMGFYAIFLNLEMLNTWWGLVVADSTIAVPFGVLIYAAFMAGIPEELLAAARIDGAGPWRVFRSVVLPVSRNATVTVSLFAFLWAWSDFIFASTLDGGGEQQPITLGIYRYIGNNNQEWNAIMATAVVASIPATILLVIAQRYVAAGVTAGAVKD